MKKIILLMAAALPWMCACSSDDPEQPSPEEKPIPEEIPGKIKFIGEKPTELSFPVEGGEKDITFTCSEEWSIRTEGASREWLFASKYFGEGEATVTIKAFQSEGKEVRKGEIKILSQNDTVSIPVSQDRKDLIKPEGLNYSVGHEGGKVEIKVGHNVDYDVKIIDSEWVSLESSRAYTTDKIVFNVKPNATTEKRLAHIQFVSKDGKTEGDAFIEQARIPEHMVVRPYLVDFYKSANGDKWTNNSGWCSDENIGSWKGVVYSEHSEEDVDLNLWLADNNLEGDAVLANCPHLGYLNLNSNKLSSLDVTGCKSLVSLECSNNILASLKIAGCTNLNFIRCQYNYLTELDLPETPFLQELYCNNNKIKRLDISAGEMLKTVMCLNNALEELVIRKASKLKDLLCSKNNLTKIDVSGCTDIETLSCSENPLTELDISKNTFLKKLYCSSTNLNKLDISSNKYLTELFIHDTKIDTVYVWEGFDTENPKNSISSLTLPYPVPEFIVKKSE